MLDAGYPQGFIHPMVDRLFIEPEVGWAECYVQGDSGSKDLVVRVLEYDADKLAHFADVCLGDRFAPDQYGPGCGPEDTVEMLEEGALAGPVRPHHGDPGISRCDEIDAFERFDAARV